MAIDRNASVTELERTFRHDFMRRLLYSGWWTALVGLASLMTGGILMLILPGLIAEMLLRFGAMILPCGVLTYGWARHEIRKKPDE